MFGGAGCQHKELSTVWIKHWHWVGKGREGCWASDDVLPTCTRVHWAVGFQEAGLSREYLQKGMIWGRERV